MRKFLFILCLVAASIWALGQQRTSNQVSLGIKGGVNFAGMTYTDWHLSELPQQMPIRPVGGIFVDIPLSKHIGLAPEVMYVERGMKTAYFHYSNYEVQYEIHSRYVDLRLPFLAGINITSWMQPYLVAGLDVGWLLGGNIHLRQLGFPDPDTTIMIGKANMRSLYFGAFGGLGIRFFREINGQKTQLKIDATYNFDFVDTFTDMEHSDEAQPINVNAYNITGKRFPKGIEITVGITIPLRSGEDDACYSFSKNRWK